MVSFMQAGLEEDGYVWSILVVVLLLIGKVGWGLGDCTVSTRFAGASGHRPSVFDLNEEDGLPDVDWIF